MDELAKWIGYAAMTAGGVALLILAWWWVMERIWQGWKGMLNSGEVYEAVSEWKKAHPDKWKASQKRNGYGV